MDRLSVLCDNKSLGKCEAKIAVTCLGARTIHLPVCFALVSTPAIIHMYTIKELEIRPPLNLSYVWMRSETTLDPFSSDRTVNKGIQMPQQQSLSEISGSTNDKPGIWGNSCLW